jgi:ABC-type molybdate transport system permease subunit
LFVLEMDNLAYQYGIHEQNREIMEADGTMYLNARVHDSLKRTKNAHLISVPLGIVATLLLIRADYTGPYHLQIVWMLVCSLSFWVCGLVEVFIFSRNQSMSMRLRLLCFEVSKMFGGEMAIWCALCLLYPYFIPRFFSGAFW